MPVAVVVALLTVLAGCLGGLPGGSPASPTSPTGETVHEGTYTLDPGTEREVYDVADADPDGVESFRVTATARNATGTVTIETSACSTDAFVEITSSGELDPLRGVC